LDPAGADDTAHFEMQMRAEAAPRAAGERDALTGGHPFSFGDQNLTHMAIQAHELFPGRRSMSQQHQQAGCDLVEHLAELRRPFAC
jgi:hypothetical protein